MVNKRLRENMIYQVSEIAYSVTFSKVHLRIETLEGTVACAVGDAVITGSHGESWPVQRDGFFRKYTPVPGVVAGVDGQYMKRLAFVEARRLTSSETIKLSDGRGALTGESGDWCVTYGLGNRAFVRTDIFAKSYLPSKAVTVFIGIERSFVDSQMENVVAAELTLRAALPDTPIIFVPQDADDEARLPLWFKVTAGEPRADGYGLNSLAVMTLAQLVESGGAGSLLGEIGRLKRQSSLSFTLDRFRSLVASFFNEPVEASEREVIAAQLFAVNELNWALQRDGGDEHFVSLVPDALVTTANNDLRRVGAVADALAGQFQKKWQQLVLADAKAIASVKSKALIIKPLVMLRLFTGNSIVFLGMLAALGLASFSELAEGCASGDWFAWIGCATESWRHWMEFAAFAMYIGALAFAWWRFAVAKVRRYESTHQDYRLLAECLRVQYVLSNLGVVTCVADEFAVGKNAASSWVLLALRSLIGNNHPTSENNSMDSTTNEWAMKAFVNEQIIYHETTLIKRREDAIAVLSFVGRFGAGVFLLCLALLIVNVASKLFHHDAAVFSPMGQHLLLILQVVGLTMWGSMRKVIDTFALEQEVQRGLVVLTALRRASKNERQSIITAAKLFAQDQAAWHVLRRSKPVEATTGGG